MCVCVCAFAFSCVCDTKYVSMCMCLRACECVCVCAIVFPNWKVSPLNTGFKKTYNLPFSNGEDNVIACRWILASEDADASNIYGKHACMTGDDLMWEIVPTV